MAGKSPKQYTLQFNIEHRDSFKNIHSGKKRVEMRAATVKYKDIKAGYNIIFKCGRERFFRTVSKATYFKTVGALFKKYVPQDFRPDVLTKKELINIWHSFPDYKEKIAEHGLVALEFCKR